MKLSKDLIDSLRKPLQLGIDSVYWEFNDKIEMNERIKIESNDYNTSFYKKVPFYKPISLIFNFNDNDESKIPQNITIKIVTNNDNNSNDSI